MTFPDRRRFLLGGAAALAAGPAVAQTRYNRPGYDDPSNGGRGPWTEDDFFTPRGRRSARDRFFDADSAEPDYPADRPARPGRRPSAIESVEGGPGLDYRRIYGPVDGEPFPVPAFAYNRIGPEFLRREVAYDGREAPGSIVVDPRRRFLYFVQGNGRAMRYGVGVGRQGFAWSGLATINSKQEWPDWYPPKEMIERQPQLARQLSELRSGIGMAGGPRNPLGARALYLWQGNKDTLYRIHGTVEPWTIGTSVSSGCIRMVNQDVMDLYLRTSVGTQVTVIG